MVKSSVKKRILLVDDNEVQLKVTESMLAEEYLLDSAKSGKEAMAYLLTGNAPNLILLDIVMPDLDGWEVFNRLKAISCLKDVPIAFITSVDNSSDADRASIIGAADFIMKPVKKRELLERVKTILEKHEA